MAVIKGMSGSVYFGNEKVADISDATMTYADCEIFDPPLHGTLDKEDTLTRRSRRRFYRWAHKMWKAHKWTIEELIERQHALDHLRTRSRLL